MSDSLTFAMASCRYPGWVFDRELADATFGEIAELLKIEKTAPSALFLVGDQIYADATAGAFDPKDRRERFYEAYREAWTAPKARDVLSQLPVYMMMDDHEAGNDWHPEDFLSEEDRAMREEGLRALRRYQWVHSPGNTPERNRSQGRNAYFYELDVGGFPFFVCEARTGRQGRASMLDDEQFAELCTWLESFDLKDKRPKFIVSSSVVVPFLEDDQRRERSDGWDGFGDQLRNLFALIAWRGIHNVVFLCGDSHLSNCSRIELSGPGEDAVNAFCVVASPLYAPYPFANATRREFLEENCSGTADAGDWRKPLLLPNGRSMKYRVIDTSWVEKDNFALVTVMQDRIEVKIGKTGRATFDLKTRQPVCPPQPAIAPSAATVTAK